MFPSVGSLQKKKKYARKGKGRTRPDPGAFNLIQVSHGKGRNLATPITRCLLGNALARSWTRARTQSRALQYETWASQLLP